MKIPRIANAVGQIDDDLVAGAAERRGSRRLWMKWGPFAVCLAVLLIAGAAILPSLSGGNVTPDAANERHKRYSTSTAESAIIWPWAYLTVSEKYTHVEIDGIAYSSKGGAISEALVGERIGGCTMVGYDGIHPEKTYTAAFEAYTLQNIAQSQFIAVKMEGSYYVFQKDGYAPPATFGALLDVVNLPAVVELRRFSEGGDYPNGKLFELRNDDSIWNVLSACRNAPFVEDETWTEVHRNYLSFTVTSEALGVYKVALYVTEDGYLWTNAFGRQYLFRIGEAAAGKIIRYAKENSDAAAYEPYSNWNSITGTVTAITKDYILVDDSVLCKNPADGIAYRVLLNDLRISRYVDCGVVEVGDTVDISYTGEIDKKNTIDSAVSVSRVAISFEDEPLQREDAQSRRPGENPVVVTSRTEMGTTESK